MKGLATKESMRNREIERSRERQLKREYTGVCISLLTGKVIPGIPEFRKINNNKSSQSEEK